MTENQNQTLLILDLDETLIHATTQRLADPPDFQLADYDVYQRPYLTDFLATCHTHFRLAIWSAASADYVRAIKDRIVPNEVSLEFTWARERCTQRFDPEFQELFYLKNLKKVERLGFCLERILIVEDEPRKVRNHYGNAIYVQPFVGSKSDEELKSLAKYLPTISTASNVRKVEKRNWRIRVD